jgi:hypothetical protein
VANSEQVTRHFANALNERLASIGRHASAIGILQKS